MASVAPLIVITGPTASGKSAIALELAERWGGEIICADSRTLYKYMDIGTAKPTKEEQRRVRHWGLDVVEPGQRFTVADFQHIAKAAIDNIRARGKIPFLVGGTGLYIDAVVLNYVFGPDVDKEHRNYLEKLSVDELISLHQKQQIPLPENGKNKRYLVRSIEKNNTSTSKNQAPNEDTHVFAIRVEKDVLRTRIVKRIEQMFANNIVLETQQLVQRYGSENEAMTGNIYRIITQHIKGNIQKDEAMKLCIARDWQLAKRQLTWLKRHEYVRWAETRQARDEIEGIIQNYRDA
jgi:tRNA dimethylallyltransferase